MTVRSCALLSFFCLLSRVGGLRIFHIHLRDDKNIGDVYSSPLRYFPALERVTTAVLCVDADTPEVMSTLTDMGKDDVLIVGGGGLLDHSDKWNFALQYYCERTTCILWSPGRNRHHSHMSRSFEHFSQQLLTAAAVGRTRDFSHPDESLPMLDPSCMLPGLEQSYEAQHMRQGERTGGVGYYLHAKLAQKKSEEVEHLLQGVRQEDILYNNELDVDKVLRFLCHHDVIVTSSYHGVLWATYMNIPVYSIFDFSEKFSYLPFAVKKYPVTSNTLLSAEPPSLSRALYVNGSHLRLKCQEENIKFYSTYIEPFVTALTKLARTEPSGHSRNVNVNAFRDISYADFNLRDVARITNVSCSPLNRNHVYDKMLSPKYEANLYVEFDVRFAKLLLKLNDFAKENVSSGSVNKPNMLVVMQSGDDDSPLYQIDFTDYVLKTISRIRDIQEKPSFDYRPDQFNERVVVVLGLLDLERNVSYNTMFLVAMDSELVDSTSADTLYVDEFTAIRCPV